MKLPGLLAVLTAWCWLLAFGGPPVVRWGLCAVLAVLVVRRYAARLGLEYCRRSRLPYDAAARFAGLHARRAAVRPDGIPAAMIACAHRGAVEVATRDWDPAAEHERVAWWCAACKTQLPPDWSPRGDGIGYVNIEGLTELAARDRYAQARAEVQAIVMGTGGAGRRLSEAESAEVEALFGLMGRLRELINTRHDAAAQRARLSAAAAAGEPVVIDGNLEIRPEPRAAVWESPARMTWRGLAFHAADARLSRIDLVAQRSTGLVHVIPGCPLRSPQPPCTPTGERRIAYVSIPAGAVSIGEHNVTWYGGPGRHVCDPVRCRTAAQVEAQTGRHAVEVTAAGDPHRMYVPGYPLDAAPDIWAADD